MKDISSGLLKAMSKEELFDWFCYFEDMIEDLDDGVLMELNPKEYHKRKDSCIKAKNKFSKEFWSRK